MSKGAERQESTPLPVIYDASPLQGKIVYRTFRELYQAPAEQRKANKKRELEHLYYYNLPLLSHLLEQGSLLEAVSRKWFSADAILNGGFLYYATRRRQIGSSGVLPKIQLETIDNHSLITSGTKCLQEIEAAAEEFEKQGLSNIEIFLTMQNDPKWGKILDEIGNNGVDLADKTHEFTMREEPFTRRLRMGFNNPPENIIESLILGALETKTLLQGNQEEEK